MQVQIAGLPWFFEDDYESFRTVLPDRIWHPTFRLWLAAAEQTKKRLEQQGIRAVEAHVRSHAFVAWCRADGRDINTESLLAFANEVAARVAMGVEKH